MTTPLTPDALAAIERRAAAATEARASLRARLAAPRSVFDVPVAEAQQRDVAERDSAADVPALLRHIAALTAQHAADVAAAVAREREACARLCEERAAHLDAEQGEEEPDDANDVEMEGYARFCEAIHLTEAIRERGAIAALPPTTGGA